ncbi:MAG: hypothetical protein WDO69_27970 [Pseudomonadota bacterium]
MSPAPHLADSAYEQNCLSGQRKPASPPHILPAGAPADPDGAGAGAEDSGAGGGSGPELTTPPGVSSGTGLALALAPGLGLGVTAAVGGGAAAGGVGCAEQLTSTVNVRNVTHSCTRFDLPMQKL